MLQYLHEKPHDGKTRSTSRGEPWQDRLVWIFGWRLRSDSEVAEVSRLFETASTHGLNGAVISMGLDTLCKKDDDFFRRLEEIRTLAQRKKLELIPAVLSVGYGGSALLHDRHLAAGLPVKDAPFS